MDIFMMEWLRFWTVFYAFLPQDLRALWILFLSRFVGVLFSESSPYNRSFIIHMHFLFLFVFHHSVSVQCALPPCFSPSFSANPPCHTIRYTREQLLSVNSSNPVLSSKLLQLNIAAKIPRRRRCRVKKTKQKKIPVFITPCIFRKSSQPAPSVSSASQRNLLTVPVSSSESTLNIALLNAQSVGPSKKRTEINLFITDNNIDIMILTETWLRPVGDEAKINDLSPSGYYVVSVPRPCGRGGGLAFIVKNSLKQFVNIVSSFSFRYTCFEPALLTFSFAKQRTNIMCVYRPPPSRKNKFTDTMFFDMFPDLLHYCNNLPGKTILTGDFNFHFDMPDNTCTKKLCELTQMFGYMQSVSEPTHRKGHILDLVFSKPDDCLNLATCLKYDLETDHITIMITVDASKPRPKPSFVHLRSLRKINMQSFSQDILQAFSSNSCSSVSIYNCNLRSVLDKHAPLGACTVSYRKPTPWFHDISEEFCALKRDRRRAERKWRKSGLVVHKEIYDSLKQKIADLVEKAKTSYYSLKIQTSLTCKQLFHNLNTIMGNNFTSPLPSNIPSDDLPSVFSNFFENKIHMIRQSFQPLLSTSVTSAAFHGQPLCSFEPVSESDILKILKGMPPKSCELDPIPTKLLYENLEALLPTIIKLINISLCSGVVPCDLKTAVVKPLLKKPSLDKNLLKNYRPVSNLPFLSKILEKVVLSQLLSHLQSNNLCNPLQSAYRTGHSTETVLLRVVNDILAALDDDRISVLLLLDLSAAFDTIDHQILLSRLESDFGITSTALMWFQSYLSQRTQFVSVNGSSSSSVPLRYGVPQGSVLGPLLFVLYTTPLSTIIAKHSVGHHLFADDTQLQKSASPAELNEMISTLQLCTSDIKDWMTDNRLKLNDDKTEALLFSCTNKVASLPKSVSFNACEIPFSSSVRDLGFVLDANLSMRLHITKVCQVAYLELKRISSIRHLLTESATKTLVTSCVLSRLDYCNSLLIGAPLSVIQPLQRVQNFAARLVLKASRFESSASLLCRLHWLPVQQRIKYKTACICYNVISGTAPAYISELLHAYSPSRTLRSSSDTRLFKIPRYRRKTHAFRSFAHFGPFLWNNLPFVLRSSTNLKSFKTQLKAHLFRESFS